MLNLQGLERKQSWPNLGTIPAFAWRTEENHENLSQNSQYLGQGRPSEYEAGVLTTGSQHLVYSGKDLCTVKPC
jgi:hypothetical protein